MVSDVVTSNDERDFRHRRGEGEVPRPVQDRERRAGGVSRRSRGDTDTGDGDRGDGHDLRGRVSNLGGDFGASQDAAEITTKACAAMGRMFGCDPHAISFGQNMTSLTFAVSRALARTWESGESVVLTSLDHDANFTPWHMAADDGGVHVRVAEFDTATGILDPEAVIEKIDESTRLVAVCLASNALGSVVDAAPIAAAAHDVGAIVYVDAVHGAAHLDLDVSALGCDVLVASAYKFFGPHTGILFGRPEVMGGLQAYKVRPAPSDPPDKWETGTQSFESLAGVAAAVEYLESLGHHALTTQESTLGRRFLEGISRMAHVRLHGPAEMVRNVSPLSPWQSPAGQSRLCRRSHGTGRHLRLVRSLLRGERDGPTRCARHGGLGENRVRPLQHRRGGRQDAPEVLEGLG